MLVDLTVFDRLLRAEIHDRFDHRHLNHDIPEFAFGRTIPTAEVIAEYIWNRLESRLPAGVRLARVRVQEAPHLYADYFGDA